MPQKTILPRITAGTVLSLSLLFASCSNVLNVVISPFAPDFLPEAHAENGSVLIPLSLSSEREYTDDAGSWETDYAWYVYRSQISPYQGMDLVGRLYRPGALGVYTDIRHRLASDEDGDQYIATTYSDKDFSLSRLNASGSETVQNQNSNASSYFIDENAPRTTLYYRVSKVRLRKEVTEREFTISDSKTTVTDVEYSLEHTETSGWTAAENQ